MTKLSDIQSILLNGATARDTGSLLPAAESIAEAGDRLQKALADLLKRGLAEERPAVDLPGTWRTDGDDRFGLFITASGRAAIGDAPAEADKTASPKHPAPPKAIKLPRQTKSAAVIALLQREQGSTLAEMIEATGWLSHTTRAALTGLRKKGHVIEKSKRGEETCYRIVTGA